MIQENDVWCSMLQEAQDDNVDVLVAFKIYVLYYQSIKRDKVFQAIMKTLDTITENDDDFDFALDFAIQNKKTLISKEISRARNEKRMTDQPGLLYV